MQTKESPGRVEPRRGWMGKKKHPKATEVTPPPREAGEVTSWRRRLAHDLHLRGFAVVVTPVGNWIVPLASPLAQLAATVAGAS